VTATQGPQAPTVHVASELGQGNRLHGRTVTGNSNVCTAQCSPQVQNSQQDGRTNTGEATAKKMRRPRAFSMDDSDNRPQLLTPAHTGLWLRHIAGVVGRVEPLMVGIMHTGSDAVDVPKLCTSVGSAMHGAEHALQSDAASQKMPVHWTTSHWDEIAGVGGSWATQGALSPTVVRPVDNDVSRHSTVRVR
jgi:hypothetical protein